MGTSGHLLPMTPWHRTPADQGLPELSLYPQSPRGLAHSGFPHLPAHSPKSRAWAGKGHPARARSQELCISCCQCSPHPQSGFSC